jgi:hypothetical protein
VQWDYGDWHQAVMGVQLTTDQGPATVTWTDTFYPYGVEIRPEPTAPLTISRTRWTCRSHFV